MLGKLNARLVITLAVLVFAVSPALSSEQECYALVAGKKATADGSVLFGHNEDNARKFVAGMWKVERMEHEPDAFINLPAGTRIPQAETTNGYFWLQMPERDYSDCFLNEYGVAIATDNCPSREDNPAITGGGIGGPLLRRLVAERAKTAREGVEIVGELVGRYGYTASGRTMIICDANEGWLVAMVNGKHWAARRVPDDEVALIANTYTIHEIDLSDSENFLGSADIVEYAKKRGWYDPAGGPFDFEKAYAGRDTRVSPGNTHRQWSGLRRLSSEPVPAPEEGRLPFSVKPKKKLTVTDIMAVLRDHYEDTPYETTSGYAANPPHRRHTSTICSPGTNSSSVFQLRSWMPVEIGAVWWLAMWQPCSTPYMPLYLGMDAVPEQLGFDPGSAGNCPFCVVSPDFGPAYRTFSDLSAWTDAEYAARIPSVREAWNTLEKASLSVQPALEAYALAQWKKDPETARDVLSAYSHGVVARAVQQARGLMAEPVEDECSSR